MADLKISQFTPVTDPTDIMLAGYKGLDNVKLSTDAFAKGSDIEILAGDISDVGNHLDEVENNVLSIKQVIPNTASSTNQLVDRDTMNSSITSFAANYVTYTATGDAFPTLNDLLTATTVYHGGVAYTPTAKDYATVLVDPTAPAPFTNSTVRRIYDGAVWAYSFGINEQPLTADQLAVVNSNITAAKVATFDGYATSKQDTLIAGENITILNNVISASGGSGGDFIDKRTFIDTIRGTVGRNAHLINNNSYIILDDGIMINIGTNPDLSKLVPNPDGYISILSLSPHISNVRGLRLSAEGLANIPSNLLAGCDYEHLAITIASMQGIQNIQSTDGFLCNMGLEYLNFGHPDIIISNGGRCLCDLPNLSTILTLYDNSLLSLDPDNTFINVKNTSDCILYANKGAQIKARFPGISNWTIKPPVGIL